MEDATLVGAAAAAVGAALPTEVVTMVLGIEAGVYSGAATERE